MKLTDKNTLFTPIKFLHDTNLPVNQILMGHIAHLITVQYFFTDLNPQMAFSPWLHDIMHCTGLSVQNIKMHCEKKTSRGHF